MKTIAIYTFIEEGGQLPPQPYNASAWKAGGFDFICFVTRKGDMPDYHGAWYIDELPISWDDPRMNAVLPKLNPQSVLDGYEYSVWIDPGVIIESDSFYERCKEMQRTGVKYAVLRHSTIHSVYGYAWRLWRDGLEPAGVLLKAAWFLLRKGIGPFAGFHDTAVMLRAHSDADVLDFDRWWWECLLTRGGSHYDRLMHDFALKDTPALKSVILSPEGLIIK